MVKVGIITVAELEMQGEELDMLVATYGRRLHERRVREVARQQGQPLERVRREMEESFAYAAARWRTIEAGAVE